jgi:glucosamine-6-phosphate deaminase
MKVNSFTTKEAASKAVAKVIYKLICFNNQYGRKTVLGLSTGTSPVGVYTELINYYKNGLLSFKNVITFNLDEYYPINVGSRLSYKHYMNEVLFKYIDILPENCNIPDGSISRNEIHKHCLEYDEKIMQSGGVDLQILGIGRSGHIGFNEPGSYISSKTRVVALHDITRIDAAADFGSLEMVPHFAITMGIETILKSKKILLLSFGKTKTKIFKEFIKSPITLNLPASLIKNHSDVDCYVDEVCYSNENLAGEWIV